MMAVLVNLAGPGRSDHLDVSNASFEFISCFNSTGGFIGAAGVILKTGESLGPLLPGDLFSYQLDLSVELGSAPFTNVTHQLVDPLPSDFLLDSLVENEAIGTITCSGPPSGSSGTVTCTLGAIEPHSEVSVDLFGNVAGDAAPGLLSNTATFTVNGMLQGDPFSCSASSTWEVELVSPANVTADKTVSGQFVLGGTISYQVVLTNSGPAPQVDDPSGPEFTDVLPPEVQLVCGSATSIVAGGGVLTCNDATNTVTWNGSIPAAGSVTLAIGATIVSGTLGLPIENQGVFFFDASGDGVNDSNGTTDDPGTPPEPDPTAFLLGAALASEIPTVGALGLMALALLLAIAALPRLRR
jgi:uncharacterized repeat protein (TIGR01451 family)